MKKSKKLKIFKNHIISSPKFDYDVLFHYNYIIYIILGSPKKN